VQGSEGAALEGMAGLLGRCPRVKMIVEFWPAGLARSGYGAEQLLGLLGLLRRLGFRVYEVDEVEACVRRADPRLLGPRSEPSAGRSFRTLNRAAIFRGQRFRIGRRPTCLLFWGKSTIPG
jgi:hypothetical protein